MCRLRVASVCSGIGGAELAFDDAVHVFASEIEAFPRSVLHHHFPGLKVYGDFTKIPADAASVDVLVGGTPCQSFSVAGLRGGMADERGNLALEYLRLADRLRPTWVLWENVPGVLSSNGGRDFGAFVGGLAECGYGWAYRVLDAQYFGLAQRRKRVFVVGCLGDWRRAAAVLFEPACLRGHPASCREAGQRVAPTLAGSSNCSGRAGPGQDADTADSLTPLVAVPLLEIGKGSRSRGEGPNGAGFGDDGDPMFTLQAGAQHGVATTSLVRRLTPGECEKLQGFPLGWTDIEYCGRPAADGPRYRALGNAFAVPVVRWIARRIAREHADIAPLAEAAD